MVSDAPGMPLPSSLLTGGGTPLEGASTLRLRGRRELHGDGKRLVREAGGACPAGQVPVDDAGTEHQPGRVRAG